MHTAQFDRLILLTYTENTHDLSLPPARLAPASDTCSCKGNEQWCCGQHPHLDLSDHAFGALVNGGDIGQGIIGIDFWWVEANSRGVVRPTVEGRQHTRGVP